MVKVLNMSEVELIRKYYQSLPTKMIIMVLQLFQFLKKK